jgi:hypothetical protein
MNREKPETIQGPLVEAPMQFRLQPGGRKSGKGCFLLCPKCSQPAFVRRSERMSEQTTQMVCICTNAGCGHTYRADIVFVHSLVEGNIDRPDLDLPVCPRDQVPHICPPAGEKAEGEPTFFDAESAAA